MSLQGQTLPEGNPDFMPSLHKVHEVKAYFISESGALCR
jgi:hypothetical protein